MSKNSIAFLVVPEYPNTKHDFSSGKSHMLIPIDPGGTKMSVLTYSDHGLLRRSRTIKEAEREYRRKLKGVRKRISDFLEAEVSDSDRRLLAEVFVVEENALLLCEEHRYLSAISLLREQQTRNTSMTADALSRLLRDGALVTQ